MAPIDVPENVSQWITKFFALGDQVDDPEAVGKAAEVLFAPDATLLTIDGANPEGIPEIAAKMKEAAGYFSSRKHTVRALYTRDTEWTDVVCHGDIEFGLMNGKTVNMEFMGKFKLIKDENGELKATLFGMTMDPSPLMKALGVQ